MTKKLEQLFDLPNSQDTDLDEPVITSDSLPKETIEALDKIDQALPAVKDLTASDNEMDQLSKMSLESYQNLMDLGMNVESRYSGRVFEVAGGMLKTSLDAKVAKVDKKLKMIELQLKKEKLDKDGGADTDIVQGEGYVVTDRNSLLEKLKKMDK